ncbi:MAG: hypothetical protein M3Z02_07410 [Actinomycetota bacterium]|nr:hypothetical protein [Actinomycetota bacterium]
MAYGGPPEDDSGRREHPSTDPYADLPAVDVVVPDDARELAAEAEQVRAERRLAGGTGGSRSWFPGGRGPGVSGVLVAAVLVVCAVCVSLLTLIGTSRSQRPLPAPLRATGTAPIGSEGGLLADVVLRSGDQPLPARALRPEVVVLVPTGCRCPDVLESLIRQGLEFGLPVLLVAGPDGARDLGEQTRALHVLSYVAVDPAGELARVYAASGVTVLAVTDDGVVSHLVRDVRADQRLESLLQPLVLRSSVARPAG